ncbi:MAG: helix-turn-helix transcriptional regulator [Mangrovicoccus sp.]
MNEIERLLDRKEVETVFGISKRFLEMAVMRGDGPPFIRVGRRVLYRVADLKAWILEQRVDPSQV